MILGILYPLFGLIVLLLCLLTWDEREQIYRAIRWDGTHRRPSWQQILVGLVITAFFLIAWPVLLLQKIMAS